MRPAPVLPLLLIGIAICIGSGSLTDDARAAVSASSVTGSTTLLSGSFASGQSGDVILENDEIAVVISAIGHTPYQGISGGTVIDIGSSTARIDALAELYPYFNDSWPRQAQYTSLTIVNDGSGGGPAVVRATGVDSSDPSLAVVTDYSLADGAKHLTITTEITNNGGTNYVNFELGDAFHWGACQKYAPGIGPGPTGTTTQPWLAGTATGVSYGYCGTSGDVWGPHGSYWSDMNVVTASFGPGQAASYTRHLAVGTGDVASVATEIHQLKGTDVGTLITTVTNAVGGAPIAGASVDAYDALDRPYFRIILGPSGQVTSTLPGGDWRLVASATGFTSAEHLRTIATGGHYNEDFMLSQTGMTGFPIGDTLTVIQRPLLNIPAFALPGDTLEISCAAGPATTGWAAELRHGALTAPLTIVGATYDPTTLWWTLSAHLPSVSLFEMYDLRVTADGGIDDTSQNAVRVMSEYKPDYYFAQISDTHLPDHQFSDAGSVPEDSTEVADFRAVIADLNVIRPEFLLITGDFINEGELEDYMNWRSFSRAQRLLTELEIPVFLVTGNHDVGGWSSTPPPDGTARRNWWRFFGWPRLANPPAGAPARTQDYSFDYGPVHFIGLESYINYDSWMFPIYGPDSFRSQQLTWLSQDLGAASGSVSQVVFYHYDFSNQINVGSYGLEMALSGHTHSDNGSIVSPPYDLRTNNVCDGERSYRMVHVSNGTLSPKATVSAGATGQNFTVVYSPVNNGTNSSMTATITNNHPQQFQNGQVRFLVPTTSLPIEVTGGSLEQTLDMGAVTMCYVAVDIAASGTTIVSVQPATAGVPPAGPAQGLAVEQILPNPFNAATTLQYNVPRAGAVDLAVFDLSGRRVRTLARGVLPAGSGTARWDGRNDAGSMIATGVYVVRLSSGGLTASRKLVYIR